jgi:3-hydroxyisobutyrate dehydrogenase
MARSLAREGHDVTVWNRSADKAEAVGGGTTTAGTVAQAVSGAEVVLTVLFDAEAVLAVADDVAANLADGAVWVQSSTVGPDGARRIGEKAPGRVLDAPVLGTRQPAEDGKLVVLASGPAALVETAQPALDAIGSRTVVVGDEVGQGSALKLAANAWVGLITAGTAQSLALARALGVEPTLFLDAIKGGGADSPYAHLKGAAMLADDGPVSFALDGVRKDLGLMIDAARGADLRDDLLSTVRGLYDDASAAGHGDDDLAAVYHAFDQG